jgi:O-ureido-D-serine cyclo-ligase
VIALVTAASAAHLDEDLPPLVDALAARGHDADVVVWDDAGVDWSAYSAALVRSTWDYVPRREEFLAWAARAARATVLVNPPVVLAWCTDKHYLAELAGAGVPVTPTTFVEPGEDAASWRWPDDGSEVVVKPAVSAGSLDTARYRPDRRDEAVAHVGRLLAAGRSALVQPYLAAVDDDGETALVVVDGVASHAVRKGPILRDGTVFVEGLYAAEHLSARAPTDAELAVAGRAVAVVAGVDGGRVPLYVRVDLVPSAGGPVVLEVEACEPSLFLTYAPGATDRLADALLARLARAGAA